MLKKLALGTIVPLFAVLGLFGCQSLQEQANATEAANTTALNASMSNSNWPKMVTIPSGTRLLISLDRPLRTDLEMSGDDFQARIAEAVRLGQMTVLPKGTEVWGRLTHVQESRDASDKAQMTLSFDRVVDPSDRVLSISAAPIVLVAAEDATADEQDVMVAAVVDGLIRETAKSEVIGATAGAVSGSIIRLSSSSRQIKLPAGQRIAVELSEPLRVEVTQLTAGQ